MLDNKLDSDKFRDCLAFVLKFEGGRSSDRHDPGGNTMQGVTQSTYDAWRCKHGLRSRHVFNMEMAECEAIYRNYYWDRLNADSLPPGVDLCAFDLAVNSGVYRAQEFIRNLGPVVPSEAFIRKLCDARLHFLRALSTWRYFGRGWQARIAGCQIRALEMARANGSRTIQDV